MPHRKVFISILGTSNYGSCQYTQGDFTSSDTHFIQKATLEFLNVKETWTAQDIAYIFLTPTARTSNWQEKPVYKGGEEKGYRGLAPILEEMKLPCPIETVDITEAGDEQGLWRVFQTIYDKLQEGDELYIDITHSFRYLPMLLLVLCNYAKFLKQTKVVHISYGNYEAKATIKPLVDLMPLVTLQEWTEGASNLLDYGFPDKFYELSDTQLRALSANEETRTEDVKRLRSFIGNLKTFSQERIFCRGLDIINGKTQKQLQRLAGQIENVVIAPLEPIFEEIKRSLSTPSSSMINTCIDVAQWCYDKQLYQQSATILEEGLISYFSKRHGIALEDKDLRELVTTAVTILNHKIPPEKQRCKPENRQLLDDLLNDNELNKKKLIELFSVLIDLRNDYNHAGFREKKDRREVKTMRIGVKDSLDKAHQVFPGTPDTGMCEANVVKESPLFLNLSNHPSDKWSKAQLDAARAYGEVVDMPFPEIDPGATTEEIHRLAEEYAEEISCKYPDCDLTVHLMGEMTFAFRLVTLLHARGVRCVASTTQRKTSELEGGKKESIFEFEAFREY